MELQNHIGRGPSSGVNIVDESPDSISSLQRRLALLTDQVDTMQVEAARRDTPWHRQPSLVISALAVVISIVFSAIGLKQTLVADVQGKQDMLRETTLEIIETEDQLMRLGSEYADNPLLLRQASGLLNGKRLVLTNKAQTLVEQLGNDADVSSITVLAYEVGMTDGKPEEALALYSTALELAESPVARSNVLRSIGSQYRLRTPVHDVEKGREYLQQAVDIFAGQDDDFGNYSLAENLLFWAAHELADGETDLANALFDRATEAAEAISAYNPSHQAILMQIEQARSSQPLAPPVDLSGDWEIRFDDQPSRQGHALITYDQASGMYYATMRILVDGTVQEIRSGSFTMPQPGRLLFQWQGTRYSEPHQMPVQASGVAELVVQSGGEQLDGIDYAVGDEQQELTLERATRQ